MRVCRVRLQMKPTCRSLFYNLQGGFELGCCLSESQVDYASARIYDQLERGSLRNFLGSFFGMSQYFLGDLLL